MRIRVGIGRGAMAMLAAACGSADTVGTSDGGFDGHTGSHDARADARDAHASDASDAGASMTCTEKTIATGCVSGPCTVTGSPGALAGGATVTVTAMAVPSSLSTDAVGATLCALTVSGATSVQGLNLALAQTSAPPTGSALFQYVSPSESKLVTTSQASGIDVVGLVSAPATYGATVTPGSWTPAGAGGVAVSSSGDTPSLLLNLSSQPMLGSFYDGTHLFVCNGPRLLIYDALPASPATLPDVVLGQPDLNTFEPETTSSLFGTKKCAAVWSDGQRVAAIEGSRVLIWQSIPTTNQTPADLVLGQPDFSSNVENGGGVSATSLIVPQAIASNGTQLVVADYDNNRALVWNAFPTTIDQPADFVIGQSSFFANGGAGGAVPIVYATGVAMASDGMFLAGYGQPGLVHIPTPTASNPASDFTVLPITETFAPNANGLWSGASVAAVTGVGLAVSDTVEPRVAVVTPTPTAPSSISFVLGQPSPSFVVESPVSASSITPDAQLSSGALLMMSDTQRLLIYDDAPTYNFAPATRALGQAGFTTNGPVDYRGLSASTLAGPADVAFASGTLAVADAANSRVLLFPAASLTTNDPAAAVIVGQPNATSYIANVDQRTPSATTLSGPAGVALDGTHLVVADTQNHRVLVWNTVPTTSGVAADLVLGQTTFTGNRPNHGLGDANKDGFGDTDAGGMFYPTGVASDGTHLFVADRVNNRVLVWKTFPTSSGQAADAVIGQTSLTNNLTNAGGGGFSVVPAGLNLPTGVTIAGTSLWVADTENNRLVRWDNATTSPVPAAFVGQLDGSTLNDPNYQQLGQAYAGLNYNAPGTGTAAASVIRPRGVVVAGDRLYVSESDSNRVHFFDAASLAPGGELGQTTDTGLSANTGGVGATALSNPQGLASDGAHLWVADSANHRVLGYDLATDPATGAAASQVLGQRTFVTNGFNQASIAADGVTSGPRGLAAANGTLYVADTNNNRVLAFATPLVAGAAPTSVYGQPDGALAVANSGGAPSSTTLNAPRGVFTDGTHLVVADTGNNRVLLYPAGGTSNAATVVLGQSTFAGVAPNAGGVSLSSLQQPAGVYFDGTRLWVADTGNHRVLVWNTLPTSNGQPADLVLGQTGVAGDLSNQGTSEATATSLSFPSAIVSVDDVVYVADSGNNRVVFYSQVPTASGASADGVLGQPTLTSRLAATSPVDLTTLAGPIGLAVDAENLYVADRDLSRAVTYSLGALKNAGPATIVLGSAGGLSLSGAGGIAVERTPYFTSRVYVANTGGNEINIVSGVSRIETP